MLKLIKIRIVGEGCDKKSGNEDLRGRRSS
jgi:hypothetical protein